MTKKSKEVQKQSTSESQNNKLSITNISTLNARRSPKGAKYQTYTNVPENGNPNLDMKYGSFIGGEGVSFQPGNNDSNVMVTSMGGAIK